MKEVYTHGSEDSLDHDVYVVFDEIPSFKEAKAFCQSLETMNPNILVLKDGVVDWCFKGTEDECNNSLFITYHLHEQQYPLPITQLVERDLSLKLVRTVRGLLSYFSRTELRIDVKKALRSSSFEEKMSLLRRCVLTRTMDYGKTDYTELFKFFAFQIGQTRALLEDGVELFSKSSVADYYPSVRPHLYRKEDALESDIQAFFLSFLDCMESIVIPVEDGYVLKTDPSKTFVFSEKGKFQKG